MGEPINPEAWRWYHEVVGNGNVAVVDTWWQTETGAHMITPLPGATPMKPGSGERRSRGLVGAAGFTVQVVAALQAAAQRCDPSCRKLLAFPAASHSLPRFNPRFNPHLPPASLQCSHAALLWRGARHPG